MKNTKVLSLLLGTLIIGQVYTTEAATLGASNNSQFLQALGRAKAGDVISVASGVNLGSVTISGSRYPNLRSNRSMITIRSASSARPAYFTQLKLSDVRYLRFSGIKFDATGSNLSQTFNFEDSENLEVVDSVIQGRRGRKSIGLRFARISNLTVEGNDFQDLYTGLDVGGSEHIDILDNRFLRGAFDSIHLGASVNDLLIEGNEIRATPLSGQKHIDLIQFTNMSGNAVAQNITVRNNDIRSTNGVGIHGIYFGNYDAQAQNGRNKAEWYKNIVIENNYIETTQMAAIMVSYASNVQILRNEARRPPGSSPTKAVIGLPTILIETANTGVTIRGNKTATPPRAGHLKTNWTTDKEIPNSWNTDF